MKQSTTASPPVLVGALDTVELLLVLVAGRRVQRGVPVLQFRNLQPGSLKQDGSLLNSRQMSMQAASA